MIELQRARMLAQQSSRGPMPNRSPAAVAAGAGGNVPQQTAVSALQTEDQQMQRFLHRMQRRDDAQQLIADSSSGPTVPTALSRRMLHRQGVGYLDDTVAAVASAAADRFLATVLHQAVACRDQRLIGAEKQKEARRHRKRHMEQYEADTDDRRRRKEATEKQREKANNAAMSAADALKKGGSAASKKDADGGTTKTKKKKKEAPGDTIITTKVNGNKKSAALARPDRDDDETSFDSVDEEEMFYQNYYGDPGESDESDEEDDTVRLIDLRRPLEAWDFHITGKLGLDSAEAESDVEESDDDDKEDDEKSEADDAEDDGDATNNGDTAASAAAALEKDDAKTGDEALSPSSPKKVKKAPSAATTPS